MSIFEIELLQYEVIDYEGRKEPAGLEFLLAPELIKKEIFCILIYLFYPDCELIKCKKIPNQVPFNWELDKYEF